MSLQYTHQWLISAVNATGDGWSLWYNEKISHLGSFSMASNGINDKIDVTCFRLVSDHEKRVVISDNMKSKNGMLMLLLKYSEMLSAGTFDRFICLPPRIVLGFSSTESISAANCFASL